MQIVLLKASENAGEDSSEGGSDKYVGKLSSFGWNVVNIPVISFNYRSLDTLWKEFLSVAHYDGINKPK